MVNQQKIKLLLLITTGFISIIYFIGAGQSRATAESHPHPPTANPPQGWTAECVDCQRYFTGMSGNSAALDSNGRIRTTYGGDGLYYAAENPDSSYQTEVVDPNPYRGINATMVLDSSDRPHILYYAADLLRLNYAYHDGVQWHIESVPTADLSTLPHPWLVIDDSDNLHLAFINGNDLVYGFYDGVSWQFETVDTDGSGNIGRPSLDLDSNGRPHIAYGRGAKYAHFDGLDWQITTFPGTYDYGKSIALALDQNDQPHIIFLTGTADFPLYLWYRYFDGADWQLEEVEGTSGPKIGLGPDLSLTLDAVGQPVIAYSMWLYYFEPGVEYRYYEIRVSHRNQSGGWQSFAPSQYLPKDDSHYNTMIPGPGSNWTLVYKDGPYMETAVYDTVQAYFTGVVDYGGVSATHIDMAVDNEVGLHISGHRADDSGLKYFWKEQGVWLSLILNYEAGLESNKWTSIAVTADGRPYLMWQSWDRVSTPTFYTYFDGQAWLTAWDGRDFDSYQANMDSQNRFHYAGTHDSYCPYDNCLSHNRIDPDGSWNPSTVDWNQVHLGHVAIAIGTADYPHIAYPATDGLRYAAETPSGWFTTTVTGGSINYPSLALDRYNHPHIAWYDTIEQNLRYAAFDGTDWQVKTVDSSGDVGQYSSLAIDRLGRVYIAYYDASNQDLKYATFDGSIWTTTTLLSEGDVGSFSKLVMPYAAYPAIAYYDATARDLMLIYRPFEPDNFVYLPIFPAANP